MSTNPKKVPAGLNFKKNPPNENPSKKQKHETSSNGVDIAQMVVVTTSKSSGAKSTAAHWDDKVPASWRRLFEEAYVAGKPVPPQSVIRYLSELRADCLKDFRTTQGWNQKAALAAEKLAQGASIGVAPHVVTSSVKLPTVQPMKGSASLDLTLVPAAAAAREAAEKAIAAAVTASTGFVSAVYTAQISEIVKLCHVPTVVDVFATTAKAYCILVIGEGGSDDFEKWDPYLDSIKAMLTNELEMENFEFVAALRYKAKVNERKATAVSTARADTEMTDATKPVGEIVDEKIAAKCEALMKRIKELERVKAAPSNEVSTSTKASAPAKSKPKASSTSRVNTKPPLKPTVNKKEDTQKTSDEEEVEGHERRRRRRKRRRQFHFNKGEEDEAPQALVSMEIQNKPCTTPVGPA
ncbi:hypothetical protein B0H14DRAFT_2602257 [Mycena olivaceomarginata]|nr:hypothetical protein B0H14DRAFT_2602257 [Mycena olivaceomarginata]